MLRVGEGGQDSFGLLDFRGQWVVVRDVRERGGRVFVGIAQARMRKFSLGES